MAIRTCKTCNSQFNACTDCSLVYDWERKYCSEKCWRESEEYLHASSFVQGICDKAQVAPIEIARLNEDVLHDMILKEHGASLRSKAAFTAARESI